MCPNYKNKFCSILEKLFLDYIGHSQLVGTQRDSFLVPDNY